MFLISKPPATLFSGHYSSRHQSWKLKCPHFAKWDRWKGSFPKILQDNGYYVGHVGKWQYYNDNRNRFDWSRWHEGKHWYTMYGQNLVSADDRACDDAVAFLGQRPKDKPFALSVAFYPPKPVGTGTELGAQWTPKNETLLLYQNLTIQPPHGANGTAAFEKLPSFLRYDRTAAVQRWNQRYKDNEHYQQSMKNMYALITQVDDACRRIVDELKQQGEYNNTMIIFTTDNGMFHGSHGLAGKWYPYQESSKFALCCCIYSSSFP
jgi:arylsulfatase